MRLQEGHVQKERCAAGLNRVELVDDTRGHGVSMSFLGSAFERTRGPAIARPPLSVEELGSRSNRSASPHVGLVMPAAVQVTIVFVVSHNRRVVSAARQKLR